MASDRRLIDDPAPFAGDPFFAVPRQRARLSIGDVLMPAFCKHVAVRLPLWFADHAAVAAMLAGTGLVPQRFGNRAIVALSFFHYRRATVGPYREVGLLVVARSRRRFRRIGAPAPSTRRVPRVARGLAGLELALDNDVARVGGEELLGLRKYVATVEHELRGDWFEFRVRDPRSGDDTLTVSGRIGPGVVVPSPPLVNITDVRGIPTRVQVDTDGSWRIGPPSGFRVTCDPHDGHLGSRVAHLALGARRPFCVLAADDLRGRLNLGVRLTDGSQVDGTGLGAAGSGPVDLTTGNAALARPR